MKNGNIEDQVRYQMKQEEEKKKKSSTGRCVWHALTQGTYLKRPVVEPPKKVRRKVLSKNQMKVKRRALK